MDRLNIRYLEEQARLSLMWGDMSWIPKNHPNYQTEIERIKNEYESREIEDWEIFMFLGNSAPPVGPGEINKYAAHLKKQGMDGSKAYDLADNRIREIRVETHEECPCDIFDRNNDKKWWKLYYSKLMELFES